MKPKSAYLNEFNCHHAIKAILFVSVIYFLRVYIWLFIELFIIGPFAIDKIKSSKDLDLLSILITIVVLSRISYLMFFKKQMPSIKSLINITALIILYIFVIRSSGAFEMQKLNFVPRVYYLDILLLLVLLIITRFKYYQSLMEIKTINGFIEDNYDLQINTDDLGRGHYAKSVAIKILDTAPLKKAFVIAINSPWGFGKTGFLLLVEKFFKKKKWAEFNKEIRELLISYTDSELNDLYLKHQNIIVLRYNPWKNFDDRRVILDFFEQLSNAVNEYDTNLSSIIKKYGKCLSKVDDSVMSKLADTILDNFTSSPSLKDLFTEINNSILRIQKRIVIFVDDLDRLTGDELLDMIKLIRNTADFNNVVFIVAYDHNYVLNTIDKKDLISSKEEYLKKIVQLEISLPIFRKNILLIILNNLINTYAPLKKESARINEALNEILGITTIVSPKHFPEGVKVEYVSDFFSKSEDKEFSLLYKGLENVRDVIRFTNSFKMSLDLIGEFGDMYEIILLDLLKVKFLSIYQFVGDKKFLKLSGSTYEFDEIEFERFAAIEKLLYAINVKASDVQTIQLILKSIFNSKRKVYFRSVKYPRYHSIYFTYNTPNLISLTKLEKALSQGIDAVIPIIQESLNEGKYDDLRSFIDTQTEFINKDEFEIIVQTLFYMATIGSSPRQNTVLQIKDILSNPDIVKKFYGEGEEKFKDFIMSIFVDSKYDLWARSDIAGDELYRIINGQGIQNPIFSINDKATLQKVLLSCLKELLDSLNSWNEDILTMYLKNLEDILPGTRKIIITKEANTLVRNFILRHPKEYLLNYYFKRHPEPSFEGKYYYFDPFIFQYFDGNLDQFMTFLNEPSVVNQVVQTPQDKEYYEAISKLSKTYLPQLQEKILLKDQSLLDILERFQQSN